jgi:hypothetical protein
MHTRRPMRRIALLAGLVVGCGGAVALPGSGGPGGAASSDAGAGEDASSPDPLEPHGALGPDCPPTVPVAGTSCANTAAECEYGNNRDPECNTIMVCSNPSRTWSLLDRTCTDPAPGLGPGCPATLSAVTVGGGCATTGLVCDYPEARCGCELPPSGPDGPPSPTPPPPPSPHWACSVAPTDPGCPIDRPRIGSLCNFQGGGGCAYGVCDVPGSDLYSCVFGYWGLGAPLTCGGQ